MQAITKSWLLCLFLCGVGCIGQAAPEPPFQYLLQRAETIFLARIISINGGLVTFQCTESLRGENDGEMTLAVDHGDNTISPIIPKTGLEFLLLSQGDEKRGPPRPMLGHSFESQADYRGWTPYPIKRVHKEIYVQRIMIPANIVPYPDWTKVSPFEKGMALPWVKRLIERFPYDSVAPYHLKLEYAWWPKAADSRPVILRRASSY